MGRGHVIARDSTGSSDMRPRLESTGIGEDIEMSHFHITRASLQLPFLPYGPFFSLTELRCAFICTIVFDIIGVHFELQFQVPAHTFRSPNQSYIQTCIHPSIDPWAQRPLVSN